MKNSNLLSESFLNGKHSDCIEINTSIPYVSIGEYFWQGEEASNVIAEINLIYNRFNITVLEACKKYESLYL